ncbi:hypothetical protein PPYR_13085 [Photinus pyralis]|uniref:RING-type E3 ubiquitin transferase n=2 Tax=Photinus pyralis TaxID=7054 RepID=A0A5N4A833_PHOPY|nr:uncharacterized protein LOC116177902 [Photinus pyralis]KAB0793465.1 hypothetical protein PPYR_13085 [Photinus pyralis]
MYEKIQKVPNSALEHLQCALCKRYLSCSPLSVMTDGGTRCGRCSGEEGCIRVFALEVILARFAFPCIFKESGCKQTVMYNEAIQHEAKCDFRSLLCPFSSHDCNWKDSREQLLSHITESHHNRIKNSSITLELGQNSSDTFATIKEKALFIIGFVYDSTESILRYDVRYCANEATDSSVRIQLLNYVDRDCSINLKATNCHNFDETFSEPQNDSTLNINNYLSNLENPPTIVVNLSLTQSLPLPHISGGDFLNSLKCSECFNYLIPPIFDLDEQLICADCGRTNPRCVPSENEDIKRLVADVHYPCRWRECATVVKSDQLKLHELHCVHRSFDCFFPTCRKGFRLDSAIDHLLSHRAIFMPIGIEYTHKFAHTYNFKHLFTIREGVIVVIQHSNVKSEEANLHRVALFSSNPTPVTATIDFEHSHCKIKSKLFLLVSDHNTEVSLDQLPPCFKDSDELKVALNVDELEEPNF